MPSHHCCVPGCTASTRKQQKLSKYPWLEGVTFFSFPNKIRASSLRRRWIKLIRREPAWTPNKYSRICSRHFLPGGDCPTLFPYNNFKMPSILRSTQNSSLDLALDEKKPTKELTTVHVVHDLSGSSDFASIPYTVGEITVLQPTRNVSYSKGAIESNTPTVSEDHDYVMKEAERSQMCDAGTQTDMTMSDIQNMNDDLKSKTEKLDDKEALFRDLFLETVVKDDEHVRFYTGLPSCTVLFGIFNILVSKCSVLNYWNGNAAACDLPNNSRSRPGPSRKLTKYQEYILTLVRLRLGFLQYFLADVFGISKSRVSQIFATWITFMSQTFDNVLKWPSKPQVKKYMPLSFKQLYPRTRAIIDCTEFFFQKPRSPSAQAATYSLYKSRNTGKCLLAISPSGTFTFVSDLYGGNASDRYITEHSGFLDLIEAGDDIMADRGFNIRDLLTRKRATLNMPPFTRKCTWGKKKRLNVSEIKKTRNIAKLRIHVERAIQRLKCFRLLSNIIPWEVKPLVNQMVKLCAFFCNLMPKLVRN